VLIERRIDQLARRDVQAARLEPSAVIYKALGPYPHTDPDKALAWHDGAHALATYRRRHDVRDEASPLGSQPRGAAARAERARAQRRIEDAQRRLGRGPDRSAQRVAARAPSIGR
jgi:hypothetical protein